MRQWDINGRRVSGLIKRVQRGTISLAAANTSDTATILAVDTANAILSWGLYSSTDTTSAWNGALDPLEAFVSVSLTNSTTVTAFKQGTVAGPYTVTYEVIEFWPGVVKSVTYGSISLASGATSGTASVAIDANKSFLITTGFTTGTNDSASAAQTFPKVVITNNTTITATKNTTGAAIVIYYTLVELN